MVYLDGISTGVVAAVRDAETGEIRYPNGPEEVANWARRVEVNGAWITAQTYDGRHIPIREGDRVGQPDDDWYDADHAEFMKALHMMEAAMVRMLAAKGITTKVEGEE